MKLNPNTTLGEYYEFCQRKITINFSLINKNKERMEVINRFTKPNMPIWAAIVASTSMPYLFSDFSIQ
jgi:predicted acylesterase/phospholipase RssA